MTSRSRQDGAAAGDELAAARSARFVEHARRYSELGWALVRLDGKVPKGKDWQEQRPDPSPEHVAGLWSQWGERWNIGVVLGSSGLVVVEYDTDEAGKTLTELLGGELPLTPVAETGRGRLHLYFKDPGVAKSARDGLELRAGPHQCVLPPSVHPETGRPYRWVSKLEPWAVALGDVPAAVLAYFAEERRNGAAAKVAEIIPERERRTNLLSLAGSMRRRGMDADEILAALTAVNEKRCRPPLGHAEVEALAHDVGARYPAGEQLGRSVYGGPTRELASVLGTFRKWLYLPDAGALYVALATVVANRLPGDPIWLLLVGASSSGKTEVLVSLAGLEEIEPAATLTEAALLSGVPRKDVAAGASGGLLRKVGDYGILTLKDFGSVLSMHRDARAGVLAALRECYDGAWDRPVGADGGKVLSWRGKLGLIAGVTTVVDRHHAVIDSLGSRFAFYRIDVPDRKLQADRALKHRRRTSGMREELREAVAGFFAGLELPQEGGALDADDERRLVELSDFVTVARSPVERDAYKTREIELIPDAEAPARFVIVLASLLEGLRLIGIDDEKAWALVVKVALDSMPAQRRKVIEHLSTSEIDDDERGRGAARAADDHGAPNARGPGRAWARQAHAGERAGGAGYVEPCGLGAGSERCGSRSRNVRTPPL